MGCGSELILGDRYRCLRLIGQGGFGRTFLAQDEYQPSKPRCVLKQLYPVDAAVQAEALRLFQQESVRLAQLGGHPQIPSLHKHFHQQGYEYIAQELIDGDNLVQELAAKGKTFNEAEIRSLAILLVIMFLNLVVNGAIPLAIRLLPPERSGLATGLYFGGFSAGISSFSSAFNPLTKFTPSSGVLFGTIALLLVGTCVWKSREPIEDKNPIASSGWR